MIKNKETWQLKTNILFLFLVWIVLAVIFGMYDLQISNLIVNQNSGWALFLENYGMIPGLIVILSGVYIYYSHIKNGSDVWSYIRRTVFFLVSSGLIFNLYEILLGEIVKYFLLLFLVISFLDGLIVLMFIHNIRQVSNPLLIKYSKVVVGMALFGYVIFIQGVKYLWGRVRFRELDAAFAQFTPWYLPQGFTGFDSFPSGHAAMGFMLLAILILLEKKKNWIKNLSLFVIILWGLLLSLSRVVIGAHYASDVLFGSFFIIFAFIIVQKKSK